MSRLDKLLRISLCHALNFTCTQAMLNNVQNKHSLAKAALGDIYYS